MHGMNNKQTKKMVYVVHGSVLDQWSWRHSKKGGTFTIYTVLSNVGW